MNGDRMEEKLGPELIQKFHDPQWGSEQLESIPLFSVFPKALLMQLYTTGQVLELRKGAHAVIEGEPTRGLYLILYGHLSVYKNDPVTGDSHRLASLEKAESFGELSLFDEAPRSATVMADTKAFVFNLEAQSFERFLNGAGPEVAAKFYKNCAISMSEKFRQLNGDYIAAQQLLWKYALRKAENSDDHKQEAG